MCVCVCVSPSSSLSFSLLRRVAVRVWAQTLLAVSAAVCIVFVPLLGRNSCHSMSRAVRALVCSLAVTVAYCQDVLQAGEPIAVNVEYDVPVHGPVDAAARSGPAVSLMHARQQRAALRGRAGRVFSALAGSRSTFGANGDHTVVAVHVPPAIGDASALNSEESQARVLMQLAQEQELQEQQLLASLDRLTLVSSDAAAR